MFNDSFRTRYTSIPFAYFCANHEKGSSRLHGNRVFHNHREPELMIVLEGTAHLILDNATDYTITKGDVILIPPFVSHCYYWAEDERFYHHCACFDLSLLYDKELAAALESGLVTIKPILKADSPLSESAFHYIEASIAGAREQKTGSELKIIGNLSLLFSLLQEHHCIIKNASTDNNFFRRVLDIIDTGFNRKDNISSSSVAKMLFLSPSHFCRKFKESFGCSFTDYLCMYKLEKSKVLLTSTNLPVSEISLQTGFCSFSYYDKMFKKYTGITPTEFRKKVKESGTEPL